MSAPEVLVVRTGTANLASICAGLRQAGAAPRLTESAAEVRHAARVVLPGVGAFGPAMARLRECGLAAPLAHRIRAGEPTLAVCLGLQLLCAGSDESPGVTGLGVWPDQVRRAAGHVRVPQLGWNRVLLEQPARFLRPGYAYYANSFQLAAPPAGWTAATSFYGGQFVAALERDGVLACQFHPELSGAWGGDLLRRWLMVGTRSLPADPLPDCRALDGSPPPVPVRVIPCLDTRDGRVVKGVRFQDLRDAGAPVELAAGYEAAGADELVVLDVSATPEGRGHQLDTVGAVRAALSIPLTVGGGVRSVADVAALLEAGADKVAVNTAAVLEPALLEQMARQFGRQCTVLALDAARTPTGRWEVVTRSGRDRTGRDVLHWASEAAQRGAGEILLTSWYRDGTRLGYDLDLVRAVTRSVPVPVIASGGAAHAAHLAAAIRAGASAVLAASIFHDGEQTVQEVKQALRAAGVEVRP